jgi:hypothetical protein
MADRESDDSRLITEFDGVLSALRELTHEIAVTDTTVLISDRARDYLRYGVARRLLVIRRALLNVFRLYPPTRSEPLAPEDRADVQINLHAFVINVCGLFDNLAWAFVLQHNLEKEVGARANVGMFLGSTKRLLPRCIRDYLEHLRDWHYQYLRNYRDALAHRIPLYVPPATYTEDESRRFDQLQHDVQAALVERDLGEVEEVLEEQRRLGTACPIFMHSFVRGEDRPVYLHAQMICDAKTVAEFCRLFLDNWHIRIDAPEA